MTGQQTGAVSNGLAAGALILIGGLFIWVAVMPAGLRTRLMATLRRTQDRLRTTGERNPYIKVDTDPDKFLRDLRIMASVGVVMLWGLGVWVLAAS